MNNIKCLRESKGLSQSALATYIGVSQQAVARWETGTADPRWDMAPRLADFFGCTTDALYGREPPLAPPCEAAS